ncbi:SagB family peptide dehydrogenase (plasmid) [Streptomyces sp. CA-294286]|uniref:SagB family peptide dehydrogenase n=1 Tax=Streptomyces sp. CA-294286 TaxID=3240070 RepID=UPI003D929AB1
MQAHPSTPGPGHDTGQIVRYSRNPDVLLEWQDGAGPVLIDCRHWRKFAAGPRLLELLNLLDRPLTAREAHTKWNGSAEHIAEGEAGDGHDGRGDGREDAVTTTRRMLERLADVGLLRASSRAAPPSLGLTPYDLAAHARAGQGMAPGTGRGPAPSARLRHPHSTDSVALAADDRLPSGSLRGVLDRRRSLRGYAPSPLPLDLLGALLGRSARVRGRLGPAEYEQTQRPSPSGGGRHSIELYVLARDVEDLAQGAYHYDPFDHVLHRLAPWDEEVADVLRQAVTVPAYLEEPPPVGIYLASHAARTGWKYEGLALSLIYRDAGCLLQTLCLTATDLGLAACPTGTMRPTGPVNFLAPHQEMLLHVGNLALGMPRPGAAPSPPQPLV